MPRLHLAPLEAPAPPAAFLALKVHAAIALQGQHVLHLVNRRVGHAGHGATDQRPGHILSVGGQVAPCHCRSDSSKSPRGFRAVAVTQTQSAAPCVQTARRLCAAERARQEGFQPPCEVQPRLHLQPAVAFSGIGHHLGPTATRQARLKADKPHLEPGLAVCRWVSPRTRGLASLQAPAIDDVVRVRFWRPSLVEVRHKSAPSQHDLRSLIEFREAAAVLNLDMNDVPSCVDGET